MIRTLTVLLLLLLFSSEVPTYSQSVQESSERYKDFILDGNTSWLLTTDGLLKQINLASGKMVESTTNVGAPVVAIAKDRKGNIVIGDSTHHLKQYNKLTNQWDNIATYSGTLTGIVFHGENQCLLVTNHGVVDPNKHITYFPPSNYSHNMSVRLIEQRWVASPAYFLDSHDQLWLGFNYGEWGGDVFAFDTKNSAFVKLKMSNIQLNSNPVFAFCEDLSNVYMSGGISHMFLTHGSIIKFINQTGNTILVSKDKETPIKVTSIGADGKEKEGIMTSWRGGHQIGPTAYNPIDKCLYFYSQLGIYKGSPVTDLSDIKQWQNVLKPNLQSSGGQQYAAGPAMNVKKMLFTPDGTLFVLADHEGLGIYTNKELRFIK